jgi:ribosomal protein L32E
MLHAALHTVSFVRGKMHSDWFNRTEVLRVRWKHGEKVGYCYPSGLEKTLFKWDTYVPLVTKGLKWAIMISQNAEED